MSDLVHRFAPSSARARMLLTAALVVTAVLGVFATSMAGSTPAVAIAVLATVAAAGLAVSLASGLVEQAEAAPSEANPAAREKAEPATEADPITTLQQRYAEGELTDAEFERRMEQLMESDAQSTRANRSRNAERTREREKER